MKDITVVTAFFDIGRGNYSDFQRSSEKYIQWFARWARLKNKLIVYLQDDEIAKKVKEIRDLYGLGDNTIIEKIEDVEQINSNILLRWKQIENNKDFIEYRNLKANPENKAMYNYVNLIKSYFMADASKKYVEENSQVAWIDFGFEHGGEVFEDENDYSFLWEYDFGNKITLFYKNEITTDPIFKIIKTFQPDCILGSLIVAPKSLCEKFWKINLDSANILADIGFMDDDQLIYLLSYRRNPELFNLVKSDWFLAIKQCGGGHIKLKKLQNKKLSLFTRIKNKIKKILNKK